MERDQKMVLGKGIGTFVMPLLNDGANATAFVSVDFGQYGLRGQHIDESVVTVMISLSMFTISFLAFLS